MTDVNGDAFRAYKTLFWRWTRAHWLGVAFAVAAVTAVVVLQITLLLGWHFARPINAIPLTPVSTSVAVVGDTFTYDFIGAPSVAATRTINIPAASVLGIELTFDKVPQNALLSLGWVGTRDRQKPTNLVVRLPASDDKTRIYVPLRGHPQWRDSATQLAVALSAPPGTATMTARNVVFVDATPVNAIRHAWRTWTLAPSMMKSKNVGERVLPMSFLLIVATLIAFSAIAIISRHDALSRRDRLIGASVMLFLLILASLFGARWTAGASLNATTAAWWLAASAFMLFVAHHCHQSTRVLRALTPFEWSALVAAIAALAIGGINFGWVVAAIALALSASRFPAIYDRFHAVIYALPVIAIAAVAQALVGGGISIPELSVTDPTTVVLQSIFSMGGFAALPVVIALLYVFWPNTDQRRTQAVALLFWFVVVGVVSMFSLRGAVESLNAASALAIWIAVAALTWGWLSPRLLAPIASVQPITTVHRTEHDLSSAARQLFDAAAMSVDSALAANRSGSALAPLGRMKELAPTSVRTYVADVRYALKSGRPEEARVSYASLRAMPIKALDEFAVTALAEYAEVTNDHTALIACVLRLPSSSINTRRLARAKLLAAESAEHGIAEALATLETVAEPSEFVMERVELLLLRDDWKSAQLELSKSQITPQSVDGSVYIARLGLRATGGQQSYIDQLQKLATWHNTLGVAQAGMAELLLIQGNVSGARARLIVAQKIDSSLWPLERRITDLDRMVMPVIGSAVENEDHAKSSGSLPVAAGAA
jgi:hypothetical protein